MSTLGTCLPRDQAEMIFESALEVENVPKDPRVFEQLLDVPKEWLPWNHGEDDPPLVQPRLEYVCGQEPYSLRG